MKQFSFALTTCLFIGSLSSCTKNPSTTNKKIKHGNIWQLRLLLMAVSIGIITVACQKDVTDQHPRMVRSQRSTASGFGPSTDPVSGYPFSFPAGVTQIDSISTNAGSCSSRFFYECLPYGDLPFYMTLENSTNQRMAFSIPAGIVIPCPDTINQNAVIVQPVDIVLTPNSYTCVNINAICINRLRSFSGQNRYGALLLSDNSNLTPLIQLLSTKKMISYNPNGVIQKAVWDIADSGQMSQADINAINALPNR